MNLYVFKETYLSGNTLEKTNDLFMTLFKITKNLSFHFFIALLGIRTCKW